MSLRDDLSDNARVILEGLYESGGEANMTEMKQVTGLEENKTVLYHTEEYLEPSDFVEYEVVDDGSATGITEFRLTDRGQEAVESIIEGTDDPNLVEQVEELREVVSGMKRDVDTFAGRIDHFEEEIEEYGETYGTVEEIQKLINRADEIEDERPLATEVTVDNFGEELKNSYGDIDNFLMNMSQRYFALCGVLARLEEAGLIVVSEEFKEELNMHEVESETQKPRKSRIDRGPAFHRIPGPEDPHVPHHTEDIEFAREYVESRAEEIRDGELVMNTAPLDTISTVSELQKYFSRQYSKFFLDPEETLTLAEEWGLDLEGHEPPSEDGGAEDADGGDRHE